jgi:hypothetical protein
MQARIGFDRLFEGDCLNGKDRDEEKGETVHGRAREITAAGDDVLVPSTPILLSGDTELIATEKR